MRYNLVKVLAVSVVLMSLFLWSCDEDDSMSSEFATVSGTISFDNTVLWPDSGEVLVTLWGEGIWTGFGPVGPPAGIFVVQKVAGQSDYTYTFTDVEPGNYSAISVGWRFPTQLANDACNTVTLGAYIGDANTVSLGLMIQGTPYQGPLPSVVSLNMGDVEENLDLKCDWANMQPYIAGLLNGFLQCGR